ncbi:MAG: hypothetical protein KAT05_04330 [Spirochaetes bacterium]|nr:hypothetical protein [Spirochaetota bacterium]
MQNRSQFRKGGKKITKGKITLISGIISSFGYFVIKDLKKENSLIKNTLKKIPFLNKTLINSDKKNEENFRIIDDSTEIRHSAH